MWCPVQADFFLIFTAFFRGVRDGVKAGFSGYVDALGEFSRANKQSSYVIGWWWRQRLSPANQIALLDISWYWARQQRSSLLKQLFL